jgi:hypothetical protein
MQITVNQTPVSVSYAQDFDTLSTDELIVSDIDPYRPYLSKPIDKTLVLDIEMDGMT